MARRFCRWTLLLGAFLTLALAQGVGTAAAEIAPPWCGTPVPDAAEQLPDGTDPNDPPGSFPHIPHYAIGCTLEDIAARSQGRMDVDVIGQSALGRDMYQVTINALDTEQQRRDFAAWEEARRFALRDPAHAQALVRQAGSDIKVPIFIQAGIHGDEYEGVDASMQIIERLATTARGEDAQVDSILDHSVLLFNVVQNPDGRIAGIRFNGNGFDLNRDYLTQAQSETHASIQIMKEWLPPEVLDLHGYLTPTLIEATTKPHNPSIEYDNWLKWNQPRIDANEAAMNAEGLEVQRPINDWCSTGEPPAEPGGPCPNGNPPGPGEAEGWDDWGPFYTAMYAQHVGLDSSTVEMCEVEICGAETARRAQYIITWSTLKFAVEHRSDMLVDELENNRRGVTNAARPACCPPPFDVDNNWMMEYPRAYVIPRGEGQRSDPEANRLVEWLLFNDIQVTELQRDSRFGAQTFEQGSYVVWLNQARRGLADTALSIGVDISDRIGQLYAAPAAWSHGFLWGADVVQIPRDASFSPRTEEIHRPERVDGGVEPGRADRYALELDSPTAIRTLNDLIDDGVKVQLALKSFRGKKGATLPAGSAIFRADTWTTFRLAIMGRRAGLWFRAVRERDLPDVEAVEGVPRIAVLAGPGNGSLSQTTLAELRRNVWVLRSLGFRADFTSITALNTDASDPLAGYDVLFNSGGYPAADFPTAQARLGEFLTRGGGYIGAGANGAGFLGAAGQIAGLTATSRAGNGRSGIINWTKESADSPIVGAYPSRDTAIVDPPTWFSAVPGTLTVDGRLPTQGFFAAGLWKFDPESASAPGSAVIAHGDNTGGTARLTVFAMNPLYRADPEREWPMLGSAAYWVDK
jgi:hypothetical protein